MGSGVVLKGDFFSNQCTPIVLWELFKFYMCDLNDTEIIKHQIILVNKYNGFNVIDLGCKFYDFCLSKDKI